MPHPPSPCVIAGLPEDINEQAPHAVDFDALMLKIIFKLILSCWILYQDNRGPRYYFLNLPTKVAVDKLL